MQSGRLATVDASVVWLRETAEAPDGMAGTFRLVDDACVFHVPAAAPDGSVPPARHCAVHATLGHDALPASCQHFPRLCLADDRGVRVSLSHFCPTAAAMLVDTEGPVTIVPGPAAVPGTRVPEGLDAREALPPRLHDRVLMDLDAFTAWEAHVVAALAGPVAWPGPVEQVLARLAAQAAGLSRWAPGGLPLLAVVDALSYDAERPAAGDAAAWTPTEAYAIGRAASPPAWPWPGLPAALAASDDTWVAPCWHEVAPVVRRYLAARAFGAWIAYQANGVRALVSWLALAHAVLRVECARACAEAGVPLDRERLLMGLRQADLLLVHYADGAVLADALARR